MATLCGMFESVQLIFYLFEEIFDLPYEFYPKEFSSIELMVLSDQLDTFIFDMRSTNDFPRLILFDIHRRGKKICNEYLDFLCLKGF